MTMTTPPQLPPETATPEPARRWSPQFIIRIVAGVLALIILVVFVVGIGLALFSDVEQTALTIQVIRDIFIIFLVFQGILIIASLAILILQIARLINLLQNGIMPILKNTEETVKTARGTVEFVGSNLTEPVVKLNGFLAALNVILRELFGIRRAIRRTESVVSEDDDDG